MIVLDTHIWIWWVDENPKLSPQNQEIIQTHQESGLGISIISCWEVAKLSEVKTYTRGDQTSETQN